MPKRTDIKSVLIIGAGPIIIGQACEFDYSGAQACKALREEGYKVILVNSNPATIMTDPGLADRTYVEPITAEGIQLLDAPCFSVQYHPEASPGPTDAHYLFTAFTRLMDGEENYLDIDTAKDRLAGWNFAESENAATEEN